MQARTTFRNPRSPPPRGRRTGGSSGARALSCGGFVPRYVRCELTISLTPAPLHAALTKVALSALATRAGYALGDRRQPGGWLVRFSGSISPAGYGSPSATTGPVSACRATGAAEAAGDTGRAGDAGEAAVRWAGAPGAGPLGAPTAERVTAARVTAAAAPAMATLTHRKLHTVTPLAQRVTLC